MTVCHEDVEWTVIIAALRPIPVVAFALGQRRGQITESTPESVLERCEIALWPPSLPLFPSADLDGQLIDEFLNVGRHRDTTETHEDAFVGIGSREKRLHGSLRGFRSRRRADLQFGKP
jgi:hypothetical protein